MTLPNARNYWKFDEGSGLTAKDSIGGAILTMDKASWQQSHQGTGLKFDPSGQAGVRYAETTLTTDLPAPWTVGVWVMREGATESAALMSGSKSAIKLEQWPNKHSLGVTIFGKDDYSITAQAQAAKWAYLTLVGTATEISVYIDGTQVGVLPATDLGMRFIGSKGGGSDFAAMVIDDLEVYDTALTSAQVAELFALRSGSGGTATLRWGYSWGHNVEGELMDGTNVQRTTAVKMPYFSRVGVRTIASAQYHNVALLDDQSLWAWGYNVWGTIGDGTTTNRFAPSEVFNLRRFKVNAIAGTSNHTLALLGDGTVMGWGRNDNYQLGLGYRNPDRHFIPVEVPALQGVKAVAAGTYHSLALLTNGTVMAWGYNGQGQVGNNSTTDVATPVLVQNLNKPVKAIAAGVRHSLALLDDGTVMAWGYNNYGQLGDGGNTNRLAPVPVANISNVTAISVCRAGDTDEPFSMALQSDGTVWTWGINNYGQLGEGSNTANNKPQQVLNINGVKAISAGGWHGMALMPDSSVWTWGRNTHGQLGDGSLTNRNRPGKVTGLTGIKAIFAGGLHSLAFG